MPKVLRPVVALLLVLVTVSYVGARAQAPQYHPPVVAASNALAGVDYSNRYELYGGIGYSYFNAGPNLDQGANLGGFDIEAARFFNFHDKLLAHKFALAASVHGYYGTSGVAPNVYNIKGPFVSETLFVAGPEYRLAANEHASLTLHILVGGVDGNFSSGIGKTPSNLGPGTPPPSTAILGLFNDQVTFGSAVGGAVDLNRSRRLAFRIQPEAIITNFGGIGPQSRFAISVGAVYRLGKREK